MQALDQTPALPVNNGAKSNTRGSLRGSHMVSVSDNESSALRGPLSHAKSIHSAGELWDFWK